jgi:disulfide oxidoreductase YuzD
MYKGSARIVTSTKELKSVLGPAKSLQSSKDLYEWMEEKLKAVKPKQALDMDRIRTEGFGPEAHEQEPQEKTKMIT